MVGGEKGGGALAGLWGAYIRPHVPSWKCGKGAWKQFPLQGLFFLGKVEKLSSHLPPEVPTTQIKRAPGKPAEDKDIEGCGLNSAVLHFSAAH